MKSLLVDALRQASSDDSDHALSDSGSFDVSNEEFAAAIANDEPDTPAEDELELMATNHALDVSSEIADSTPEEAPEVVSEEVVYEASEAIDEFIDEEPEEEHAVSAEEAELHESMELAVRDIETSHAVTIVGELPRPVPPQTAPALARFAPLVCVVLAAAVAGGWFLYQKFGVAHGAFGASALIAEARAAHTPGIPVDATGANANTRFPFLTIENDRDVERVMQ